MQHWHDSEERELLLILWEEEMRRQVSSYVRHCVIEQRIPSVSVGAALEHCSVGIERDEVEEIKVNALTLTLASKTLSTVPCFPVCS